MNLQPDQDPLDRHDRTRSAEGPDSPNVAQELGWKKGEEFKPGEKPTESSWALAPEGLSSESPIEFSSSPEPFTAPESSPENVPGGFPAPPPSSALDGPEPPPLFQSWSQPETVAPERIPHLGHLCLLAVLAVLGLMGALLLAWAALSFHLFGVSTADQADNEIHYELGAQAASYLLTLLTSLLVFPAVWNKSFFAGMQWNGAAALRLRRRLLRAAFVCLVLAMIDGLLFKEPTNAPIDKLFEAPGAPWLLFAFGVTLAPFCEEIVFRGFLLPALCTAWDWSIEKRTGKQAPPLDSNGHPQWSLFAMVLASILTSIPFALMHGEQTAFALGPFLLLLCVSLVLCWVRLSTRSLAASVLVHACYNFLLFSLMLIGTGGFRHLDKT